jgi:serine/threonine-protein kinase RsbW
MEWEFAITIPSDLAAIREVTGGLEMAMKMYAFSDEDILDTQLAVEESLTNTILHGYRDQPGDLTIHCRASHGLVEIQIEDSAPPFDPLSVPDADISADLDKRRIGGLGVLLIRKVMDDIVYRYEDGKNILAMVKRKTG